MKIDDLKGCFANVNDDMLLRENGNLYAENKKLKEENQRLNNVLNEIKIIMDDYYTYDYEDENLERLNVIDKINHIIKESDK